MTHDIHCKTILIVEDDTSTRLLMKNALSRICNNIIEAELGTQAIEAFISHNPNIIMLDINLPDRSGFEVCEQIRALSGGDYVPIVMVTSLDDWDSIDRAYKVGATDFITKPINWGLLSYRAQYLLRMGLTCIDLSNHRYQLQNTKLVAQISDWHWDIVEQTMHWSIEMYTLLRLNSNNIELNQSVLMNYVFRDDIAKVRLKHHALFTKHKAYDIEYRLVPCGISQPIHVHEQAQVLLDKQGNPRSILGTIQNITNRKQSEEQIHNLAYHDSLTGVLNRSAFVKHLDLSITSADEHNKNLAILFIDLGKFKEINDTLGHDAGDQLLCIVASRLHQVLKNVDQIGRYVREDKALARWGGDEFIILLNDCTNIKVHLKKILERILNSVIEPIQLSKQEVFINCSMGISIYPDDGTSSEELIHNADIAMYKAKSMEGSRYHYFTHELQKKLDRRLKLESHLRYAIEKENLFLQYQPQFALHSGQITSFEALIRWEDPELGLIQPNQFIPIAEENGMIIPIGRWVIRQVCQLLQQWINKGINNISIAINLSAKQFACPDFLIDILEICHEYQIPPSRLDLELTESSSMENPKKTILIMQACKAAGFHLSIDDFGTGYSNLSYLKDFPIDTLKIDLSFVRDISMDPLASSICKTIVHMSHMLGFDVIAEGVETPEQLSLLRRYGCDSIQGYLVGRPVSEETCLKLLQKNSGSHFNEKRYNQRTILLVDDEINVLEALSRILKKLNCTIFTAPSTQEAFTILSNQPVDIVISDHHMPIMSGVEFLQKISTMYPETIRILLTGTNDLTILQQAVNHCKLHRYFYKPWNSRKLVKEISEFLNNFNHPAKHIP